VSTPTRWPNFSREELTCHCGCGEALMDEAFMDMLQALRRELGFPFKLNSAYRCPKHDAQVGSSSSAGSGPHTLGKAVDVAVAGEQAYRIVQGALARGFSGIGIMARGPWGGRYVHLDTLRAEEAPRPALWSY